MCLRTVISSKIMCVFRIPDRDMVESMTATAERIANYEMIHGKDEVEQFLDAVLAIQEHIDPSIIQRDRAAEELRKRMKRKKSVEKTIR